jgi:hypothetical protein
MDAKALTKLHPLKSLMWVGLGLAGIYVSTYLSLSLCGQYRPIGSGCLHEWEESSFWTPAGFRVDAKQSPLRLAAMKTFYPLWIADVRWLHKRRDIYWKGGRAENGEWTYETNSWAHDVKGEWVFTNFTPSAVTRK